MLVTFLSNFINCETLSLRLISLNSNVPIISFKLKSVLSGAFKIKFGGDGFPSSVTSDVVTISKLI